MTKKHLLGIDTVAGVASNAPTPKLLRRYCGSVMAEAVETATDRNEPDAFARYARDARKRS